MLLLFLYLILLISLTVQLGFLVSTFLSQNNNRWGTFYATTLFLFSSIIVVPILGALFQESDYCRYFFSGFVEECLKVTSLTLYCNSVKKLNRPENYFHNSEIWSLALIIALLENAKITLPLIVAGIDQIVFSDISLYSLSENLTAHLLETVIVMNLLLISLLRVLSHFFMTWLFLFIWNTSYRGWAVTIAGLHGLFNVVSFELKSYSIISWVYNSFIALWFLIFVLMLVMITWALVTRFKPHLSEH
ncbi:hypothetical protein [Alteromonas lipotrueiana]|uniref:hypothetical protein n=1 Tax=Alteromonas lipotrueiana TaxID=2803815 RepID=UPI001C47E858|nr:hypothetical protein [Alteromonas lipotrueiana]